MRWVAILTERTKSRFFGKRFTMNIFCFVRNRQRLNGFQLFKIIFWFLLFLFDFCGFVQNRKCFYVCHVAKFVMFVKSIFLFCRCEKLEHELIECLLITKFNHSMLCSELLRFSSRREFCVFAPFAPNKHICWANYQAAISSFVFFRTQIL